MRKLYTLTLLVIFSFISNYALAEKDTVTNNLDNGFGSLRAAIDSANARPGLDTIIFELTEGTSFTITLSSALPDITSPVFIDGYSQAGSAQGTNASRTIRINVSGLNTLPGEDLFRIFASDVTIAGLAIYESKGNAINVFTGSDNVHIWGNYIGTDSTGLNNAVGNVRSGIIVNIGGFPEVQNMYTGTNGDQVNDANEGNVVCCTISSNPAADGDGILYYFTWNSVIAGNIVGLNKNGTGTGFGNAREGIFITGLCNNVRVGTNGDGFSDDLEGNLVSSNAGRGILVAANSTFTRVSGNTVGLDAAGNPAGNGKNGIELLNANNSLVGVLADNISDAEERNIVSSNTGAGIVLSAEDFLTLNNPTINNSIVGNIIGTTTDSVTNRGNTGSGILIFAANTTNASGLEVSDNLIGSDSDNFLDEKEGNVIAFNDTGILVLNPAPQSLVARNKFARNSIYNNTMLGIDLNGDNVTSNDDGDVDTGPNGLMNFPIITSFEVVTTGFVRVSGFSRPNSVIEFYIADAGPNRPSGTETKDFGEGQTFLFRAQDDAALNGIVDDSVAVTGTYTSTEEGTTNPSTRTESVFNFVVPISSLPATVNGTTRMTALAYYGATGNDSTSEFGPVAAAIITPVRLITFKGRIANKKAELNWTTAEEINSSHFDIERSSNGTTFTKVGTVKSNGRRNNSYSFTDIGPLAKVNHYRLKQVDVDDHFTFSRILVLRADLGKFQVRITPNPFASSLNISYQLEKEEKVQIRLFDGVGRLLQLQQTSGRDGVNSISLTGMSRLAPGIYTVEVKGESFIHREKVVRQ
ncbi:MAG TPA: T9SS type A sorting domain-containing protein [Flavitalea sp.]|nr:T9SS type A sorting domain-containing protein [Flavitalea sp.]